MRSDDATKVTSLANRILLRYSTLENAAGKRGDLVFAVTPTFHWLFHFGQRAKLLHPRRGNTMIDEACVGVCKQIVQSCANGTESVKIPAAFVEKISVEVNFSCASTEVSTKPGGMATGPSFKATTKNENHVATRPQPARPPARRLPSRPSAPLPLYMIFRVVINFLWCALSLPPRTVRSQCAREEMMPTA